MLSKTGHRLDPCASGDRAKVLDGSLRQLVVGQDEAIRQIVNLYQMYITGMTAPDRPLGNILFLGPTGSGKTRLVEAVAETLLGSPSAVVKIDCGEYQHSHEIAKLIGSPPGYLGHRETHPILSQDALNRHFTEEVKLSLVLFDEVEKASDALWNLLLGILDKGSLMCGDNRRTDFSRAFVFMTGNLGAAEMEEALRPRWGFMGTPAFAEEGGGSGQEDKLTRIATEAARRRFAPEFINRLDAMVVFKPLGVPELRQIVDIELRRVQDRILSGVAPHFAFRLTEAAIEHLLIEGTDVRYGARHLRRAIDRLLVQPISSLVASDQVHRGDLLMVDAEPGSRTMVFWREPDYSRTVRARR
jgi:ATP-dependent Clp protease ATP-binding subunit ClpA